MTNEQLHRLEVVLNDLNDKCDILLEMKSALTRKLDGHISDLHGRHAEFANSLHPAHGQVRNDPD